MMQTELQRVKISQSLIKDWKEYEKAKYCGLLFAARHEEGLSSEPTESMEAGIFFEFIATGNLPRSGERPKPKVLQSGKNIGNYTKESEIAFTQAMNFKKMMKHYQFEIVHVGPTLETDKEIAHLDIIAIDRRERAPDDFGNIIDNPDKDQEVIIDLKYSGLLDNRWEDLGWEFDSLSQKEKIMIQAVHYKYIYRELFGRIPTFYFAVHSNKDEVDRRLFKVEVDEQSFDLHEESIETILRRMNYESTIGFKPHPDVKKCSVCPLQLKCKFKLEHPPIQTVYFSYNNL